MSANTLEISMRYATFIFCLFAALFAGVHPAQGGSPAIPKGPLSPEESLVHLQVAPGLRVELAATEPQVIDPVDIAFDEDGRLWVVEMTDYPFGPQPGEQPRSRVRVLEDRDADGRYETAQTFVDGLLFATGLQLWQGGAFVTLAGQVMYFQDTTGDGKADVQETWFSGFAENNEQLRANHPRFGPDNWIYIANGLTGGKIVGHQAIEADKSDPVSINGMDFRFDPRSDRFESISGMGQFGLTFDDFGNRFVCSNRNPCTHIVLKDRYIKRNPNLAVPSVAHDVTSTGEATKTFPLSRNWTNHWSHNRQITSACGVFIYRGDALPEQYRGNCFVCEPAGNLVQRHVLTPERATFASRRGRDDVEFLASSDDWFRPVNQASGPDGALYVVDMYRASVEHPHWLPDHVKEKLPWNSGNDRGRIYRIVADRQKRPSQNPRLSQASTAELVQMLDHQNAWRRTTAARLIYERQDKSVQRELKVLVKQGRTATGQAHALWALDGLGLLDEEIITTALDDTNPRIREQAVSLSERWLQKSPSIVKTLLDIPNGPDRRLAFQLALSLGEAKPSPEVIQKQKSLLLDSKSDRWISFAVISSLPENTGRLLDLVLKDIGKESSTHREKIGNRLAQMLQDLSAQVGSTGDLDRIASVLDLIGDDGFSTTGGQLGPVQLACLHGLGDGLARRGDSLDRTLKNLPEERHGIRDDTTRIFVRAAKVSADPDQQDTVRHQHLELLRYASEALVGDTVVRLATAEPIQSLRVKAIEITGAYKNPQLGSLLLKDFRSLSPPVRRAVLGALVLSPDRIRLLLAQLEADRISLADLTQDIVNRLTSHDNADIKSQAEALLADAVPADRKQVLKQYRTATRDLEGDGDRGRVVFKNNCAACHQVGDLGVAVGPSIADFLPNKEADQLVEAVLNPNRAIDSNYVSYTVVTLDGKTHTGILSTETTSSITLKQAEGKSTMILRQNVDQIHSNGVSLMPVGLERNVSIEQMADLIVFLRDWRFLAGLVPVDAGE